MAPGDSAGPGQLYITRFHMIGLEDWCMSVVLFPFVPSIYWAGVKPILPSSRYVNPSSRYVNPSSPRYVILVHSPSDGFDVSCLEGSIWSCSPFVWLCYVTVWVFKATVTLTCSV